MTVTKNSNDMLLQIASIYSRIDTTIHRINIYQSDDLDRIYTNLVEFIANLLKSWSKDMNIELHLTIIERFHTLPITSKVRIITELSEKILLSLDNIREIIRTRCLNGTSN